MKRKTSTRAVAVLVALFACLTLQAVNTITYTATYSPNKLTTGTDTLGGVTYATVAYEGLFNGGAPGTPSLPVDYLKFSVPWNATNFTVTANLSNSTLVSLGYMVYPNQQPRLMSDTTGWSITLPDSIAYLPNVYHPSNSNSAWVVDEGFLAGENHIVTVAVMPVAYYHRHTTGADRKMIRLSQSIDITLSYDLSDSLAMYPIIRQDTALRSEGYRLTQSLVVNPTNVVNSAPTNMTPDTLIVIKRGSVTGGGLRYEIDSTAVYCDTLHITPGVEQMAQYQYLIVTTPEFKHSVRRLAALKRQKGYTVKVVTMDEVTSHPYAQYGDLIKQTDGTFKVAFDDDAGKLRQYLKLYHNFYGTEFVLLVGDSVPYRNIIMYPQFINKPKELQSDLYFCELNSDWSDSIKGRESELFVGRILAKKSEQIDNYTDKLLRYCINPGHGNPSYLKRAFYSQSYDMRCNHEVDTIREVLDSLFTNPFVMEESDNINDKSKYPSGRDIINEINQTQYGFLSLHHHGYPSSLLTYGLRNVYNYSGNVHVDKYRFLWSIDSVHIADTGYIGDDTLTLNGLNNMTNKWHPNICYSTACLTIPFMTEPKYSELPMVFGESYTTGKDYGGPIFIGNTNSGFSPQSALLEQKVLKELLMGNYKIGVANGFGKSSFTLAYNPSSGSQLHNYIIAVQNLLGDPSLEIWTDLPIGFSGVVVSRSDNSISISGIVPNSVTVVYRNADGIYKKMSENSLNVTFNQVSPNGTIMLSKHNYIPYIAPLVLQNTDLDVSQYVFASDVVAGYSVDSGRTPGNVSVNSGTEFEIEASGTVTLQGGFSVEQGATFAIYPSSY